MIRGNFCWIATWKVTDRCNLRCAYCDPSIMTRADSSENIDRFAALDRIGSYKPRVLNISGGEPSLVKELPELLSTAKKSWNPFIRVVHNGTAPQNLENSFPYIDRLVISLDGPGGINAGTRGLDGDAVLGRLAKVFAGSAGSCPEIFVNTVVTKNNIDALPLLASRIAVISPRVTLGLVPVMPVESGLSVLSDGEAGYRRFLDVYGQAKAVHNAVIHNFDCVTRHENPRKIQCYNQYFTIRFSPRGEFFTCGAGIASQFRRTDRAFRKIFKKGGFKKLFTMLARAINGKMGKVDFTCRSICNCENWLDLLFLGQDMEYARIMLRGLRGRLTDGDYRELDKFVRENINPNFDADWFRGMVDGKFE